MNVYLKDAGVFLKETSKIIDDEIQKPEVIQASFNLALGLERILKGILSNLNPTYVLINPVFNNSIQVLYKDKLIPNKDGHNELAAKPDGDVITFKNSILRAQCISQATFDNKNLLFVVANARDIIAHNDLSLLDIDSLKMLLKRDFYPLISQYCNELNVSPGKYFEGFNIRLAELASKYNENIEQKLALLYVSHRERWHQFVTKPGYVEDKNEVTNVILQHEGKYATPCPACNNTAIIYSKPIIEFNSFEKRDVVVGLKVSELKCRYCKLDLKDYKYLDYLKLDSLITNVNVTNENENATAE